MYSVIKQSRIFYNYICYIHMQFICGILCSVSCCELLFRHWKCKDKLYVNTMTISGFHLATRIANESVCSQFPVYGETIANKEYHQVEGHNEKQKQQASGYLINAVIYICFACICIIFFHCDHNDNVGCTWSRTSMSKCVFIICVPLY